MISRVWQYSFAQAKTKAMKSQLLTSEDWHYLLRMRSLENIVRYLSGTIYGQVLSKLSEAAPNPKVLVLTLYKGLFLDYAKLLKTVPARGAKLLSSLLRRYEAENLKTLLRAIWSATPIVKTRSLLYPLDFLSKLPVDALIQTPQVTGAVEILKKTVFFTSLMQALPQFQAQGRLFPLEIAIDMLVFEHIVRTISSLKGLAYKQAKVLIGDLIDWVNINWVIRFRHFYGLSPEETVNYSLPGGARLGLHDLGNLARAIDLPSFIAALPDTHRKYLATADRWQSLSFLLQKWFLGELYRSFRKDPFQIGLQISYLLLKEMEVKSLESLIAAIALGEPSEKIADMISPPLKGSLNV